MGIACNLRIYVGIVLAILYATGQLAFAQEDRPPSAIAEFAKCSRQCMEDNEQCQKKLQGKCPKPGS